MSQRNVAKECAIGSHAGTWARTSISKYRVTAAPGRRSAVRSIRPGKIRWRNVQSCHGSKDAGLCQTLRQMTNASEQTTLTPNHRTSFGTAVVCTQDAGTLAA